MTLPKGLRTIQYSMVFASQSDLEAWLDKHHDNARFVDNAKGGRFIARPWGVALLDTTPKWWGRFSKTKTITVSEPAR